MTDAELDRLDRLCAAATPGPWEWWTSNSYRRLTARPDGRAQQDGGVLSGTVHPDGWPDVWVSEADMAFIAEARSALPALLAALEAARAEIARLERALGGARLENRLLFEALQRAQAENVRLREALSVAADYIYNPFEPDNQSPAYHKARAALAGGEHG